MSVESSNNSKQIKMRQIKALFIGDACVGKSSIINRFSDGQFSQNILSTCGIDFKVRTIELEGEHLKLQLWDTAGQERFRCITPSFYRSAHCIMLVYDSTSLASFENVKSWMNTISLHSTSPSSTEVDVLLVANKCDLQQQAVTIQQGQSLADTYNLQFIQVSAKTGTNIQDAIYLLAQQGKKYIDRKPNPINNPNHNNNNPSIILQPPKPWKERCCS